MIERGVEVSVKRQARAAGSEPVERLLRGAGLAGAGFEADADLTSCI